MTAIEIARRCAELNDVTAAQNAYVLALGEEQEPAAELEACTYLLYTDSHYQLAYSKLINQFNNGNFMSESLDLLLKFMFVPKASVQEKLYNFNIRKLEKYPYFFRGSREFLPFDELPIRFFTYNSEGYVPFYQEKAKFGEYLNPGYEEITHYYFDGSDKPILTTDNYSAYELSYLYDCTRRSEDIARDNHVYLHFTDWAVFCSYAQIIDFTRLLPMKKLVIMIEDEGKRYPIDFAEEYGIDYSEGKIAPIRVDEVKRMIWHVQLSTHNGGDFFNEILDDHPNLITHTSIVYSELKNVVDTCYKDIRSQNFFNSDREIIFYSDDDGNGTIITYSDMARYLRAKASKDITYRDVTVAVYLALSSASDSSPCDPSSRFAPILVYQPHFPSLKYDISYFEDTNTAKLISKEYDTLKKDPIMKSFKYIKSLIPIRRFTTSFSASMKYVINKSSSVGVAFNRYTCSTNILNQSFRHDLDDRYYKDSRAVRFEDGKLNPKATFTEVAKFLDIPYTESMTYCSVGGIKDKASTAGNVIGFDTSSVYRTYDEYATERINAMIEYFLSEPMKYYGYEPNYYKGQPIGSDDIRGAIEEENNLYIDWVNKVGAIKSSATTISLNGKTQSLDTFVESAARRTGIISYYALDKLNEIIKNNVLFMGENGKPMVLTRMIEPNPDMLDQPPYK